jgi:uncharacterized protein
VSFNRHLLVDGANILHAWPELAALLRRDRASARALLVQTLAAIHDAEQVRVTIVFDGRGEQLVVERPSQQLTFSVIYTSSSLTADDVIEQMVANAVDPANCMVATEDRAERETILAAGATALRAEDLAVWVKRAVARQADSLNALKAANAKAWKKPKS